MEATKEHVCWFQLAASRKMPAGWKWYRSDRITGGFLLTGCIPDGVYKTGPRKGKTKWDTKNATQVLVTREELQAEESRWQSETGKCSECQGEGRNETGWSKAEGRSYKPCQACNATGNAPTGKAGVS